MKKRYFWIYVLPVLMLTTTLAFGELGVRSAIGEQKMQTELAKVDWKMEPVLVLEDYGLNYNRDIDTLETVVKMKNWYGKQYFSSNPIVISDEDYDRRWKDCYSSEKKSFDEENAYRAQSTRGGQEIMVDDEEKRVGTVKIERIDDWSDTYVCGKIKEELWGILDYNGKVLMQSDAYYFGHLYDDICYKEPIYGKGKDTVVFNIATGEVVYGFDGHWEITANAIGYEAECFDAAENPKMYFDQNFQLLTKVDNGFINIGDQPCNRYWGKDGGHTRLYNEKLQLLADYGTGVLSYSEFNEGLCLLYYKNKLVCIDENLNVIFEKKAHIKPRYADDSYREKNSLVDGVNEEGYHDDLAVFTLDGCRYGVLDKDGNVLLEPVFKGLDTLTIMKHQHVAVFYEQELRIGALKTETGGERDE